MKAKFVLLKTLFVIVLSSTQARAQESVLFFVNPYAFNPSYAGVEGRPAFFLNYRRQWINVDGSPQIGNLSIHTPLKKFVSIGLNVNNDKRGLFTTNSALASAAYTLMLGDFKSIRFGISAGGGMSSLDLSTVSDNQDPALGNASSSFLQGNAGVSFHMKSFHGGITLPAIFEPSYIAGNPSELNPMQGVVVHASNRFYWNKNRHLLEPHLVYRYRANIPSQYEMALVYHMNGVVWIGGSHKQHIGSSAFAGLHFNRVFGLGYAYTFKTATGSQLNSPSHELQLTLLLGSKRKDVPFYSFVDSEKEKKVHKQPIKQSASAVIAQNKTKPTLKQTPPAIKDTPPPQNHQARLPETISKSPEAQPQKQTPVVSAPVEKSQPAVAKSPIEVKKLGQMPHVHDTLHPAHAEEKEMIARLEVHAENPTEHHDLPIDAHPHAERHEFVKRGSHSEELEIGDYVIAGVFRSKVNAEHFATGLVQHGFKADHGHLTEKNLWYVYISHNANIDQARTDRDRYRKMKIFRDAWLLTVHH
jgi:type IX secretion system PorP/SprF family membrane protein